MDTTTPTLAARLALVFAVTVLAATAAAGDPPLPVKCTPYPMDVDHFNFKPTDPATFGLRVCVNETYVTKDTDTIIFYTGNEAPIEEFVENSGFLFTLGQEMGALVVFVEHRYYGNFFF